MSGRTSDITPTELDIKSLTNKQAGSKIDPISGRSGTEDLTLQGIQSAGTPSAPFDTSHRGIAKT